VITGALGIDQNIVFQDLPAQKAAIKASSLDIAKLQNPAYVTQLTDQYLLSKQAANQASSSGSSLAGLLV
jgi:hypothetical protein